MCEMVDNGCENLAKRFQLNSLSAKKTKQSEGKHSEDSVLQEQLSHR
jgi:hypothetical protein